MKGDFAGFDAAVQIEAAGAAVERLDASYGAAVERHEVLRSSFTIQDGRPEPRVADVDRWSTGWIAIPRA